MCPTIIPPPSDSPPLGRIVDHDDEQDLDGIAIEAQGVAWRETRERETARPARYR